VTFADQLAIMLKALPRRHRIVFLAGVRFVQGHTEYGDSLFHKTDAELEHDALEESADRYTYRRMRKRQRE
jgi:hypothetical protein